ncbi:MAG TPA: EAL domain-containing protein [Roseiarcus sp.]|jgi:diguanylate cyclase (GGDEF)-like protein|nr:EAL domain-containing protein [Roseiarcus sp.]
MGEARRSDPSASTGELPDAIYIGFVDGLLTDVVPVVLLSAVAVTVGELASAIAAKSLILAVTAPAQLLIAAVRLQFARQHARNVPSPTVEIARMRERIFSTGALVSLTALSSWTLLSFCVTDNNFAHFTGVSMTIAYAFSLMSRSYAIYRGVNGQLLGAFIPLSAAMIVAGGWYPLGIAAGIAPLVLYMKSYAQRLRANFMAVVAAQQQAETLAARLDMALNNMSHGLCMLNPVGRLVLTNDQALRMFNLSPDDAPAGAHVKSALAKMVESGVIAEPQFARLASILARDGTDGADFVIPLETLDDRAFEITVHRMKSEGTVLVIQDVTERRNAQAEINRMARFDSVTELPNRRCFEEQLALALHRDGAASDGLTVMFLDLDDFKQVNDSLGHRTGDKLLVEIASRLRALTGPSDLVARWGGDEFVILHHHASGQLETHDLAKRIIDEINRAVIIDGSEVIVGASIGSASAPRDGASPDALLSKADIALYAAKADGRRVWRAFEQEMDAKIQIRRLIELELRAAVATDGIEVYFQPIVSVATRRIVGFEALARWRSALLGPVSPAEFIPIVEEIGLMEEMGAAMLRHACKACAGWPEEVSVSVNLSSTQFRGGNLERTILGALAAAGLAPERLDLEITESILLEDRGDTRRTLQALRAHGLRVSLDDFGTGYSSLSYLLSFPLDRIKIDRSFTMGLGIQERASVLVEGVSAMSRRLGMSVLIEGVETAKQLRMIETLGTIAEAQGYLFSRPVPEKDLRGLLERDFRVQAA